MLAKKQAFFFVGAAVVLVLVCSAYLFGAYSYPRNLWPIKLVRQIKNLYEGQGTVETVKLGHYDSLNRLTFYPDKKEVPCPFQGKDTGVLLIIGQSNSANHAEKKFTTQYPEDVVNYFGGRCYVAASPLLGATGEGGEFVTLLADGLIAKGTYTSIVIIASGVTASAISRWQRDGDLNELLISVVKEIQVKYQITDVIWHQGESDAKLETTAKVYVSSFHSLLGTLTELKVRAPIFLSIASRCFDKASWAKANPIEMGQRMLIDNKRIFLGADTDKIVEFTDRYDGCHFSQSGQIKTAEAFADSIRTVKDRIKSNKLKS